MEVRFIDTTFRDGSQSLWGLGLRSGMIEAVAETMDRAGFDVIEVPLGGLYMKKFVRDLKENPWDMARMVAKTMPNTTKSCMVGASLHPFEPPPPRAVMELFFTHLAGIGALNRAQVVANTADQSKRDFPWQFPLFRGLGMKIAVAIAYTISERHTDEYYAEKTREVLRFAPDAIYLKDPGGLLTVDRLRTLLPVILRNAGDVPVELHSHCTTGLAEVVYLEALRLGCRTLHTGIPPLANGSAQPSALSVARNARLLGYSPKVDEALLRPVAERLTAIARQDGLPIGAPLEHDAAQYIHQVPGGVISNLRYQLAEMGILHRIDEVIDECVPVRKELGYPMMITPFSQFMMTQSAINVAIGERYKSVIDELILFAQGVYGEDSGYLFMDQNLKDRLLSSPRSKELKEKLARQRRDRSLQEIRDEIGATGLNDEEFLLRYIMKGEHEIEAMRAAGKPKQYFTAEMPLLTLLRELDKHKQVRYVHVQRPGQSLIVQNRSAA